MPIRNAPPVASGNTVKENTNNAANNNNGALSPRAAAAAKIIAGKQSGRQISAPKKELVRSPANNAAVNTENKLKTPAPKGKVNINRHTSESLMASHIPKSGATNMSGTPKLSQCIAVFVNATNAIGRPDNSICSSVPSSASWRNNESCVSKDDNNAADQIMAGAAAFNVCAEGPSVSGKIAVIITKNSSGKSAVVGFRRNKIISRRNKWAAQRIVVMARKAAMFEWRQRQPVDALPILRRRRRTNARRVVAREFVVRQHLRRTRVRPKTTIARD